MIYVVLGVEFSGTTLVSELIHHSGIKMIDEEDDSYDQGGKYEHPEFQQINRDLLKLTDDRVYHLRVADCPDSLTLQQNDAMVKLINRQNNRYHDWGFKDPRSVVTYPLWYKLLPEHRIIVIYRDPAGNWPRHRWRGLRKRYSNPWRTYVHLRQWVEYNNALLALGKNPGDDFILLSFEKLMQSSEEVNRLADFLGRPVEDRRKSGMHRNRSQGDLLFQAMRWLMNFGAYSPAKMLKRLEDTREAQCRVFLQKTNAGHP